MINAMLLSGSPGRAGGVGEGGWIGVDGASGSLVCPCCEGDLDFWQEADSDTFAMRAEGAPADQPHEGPRPVGAIHCYSCCQDWEVPPWMRLTLRSGQA